MLVAGCWVTQHAANIESVPTMFAFDRDWYYQLCSNEYAPATACAQLLEKP